VKQISNPDHAIFGNYLWSLLPSTLRVVAISAARGRAFSARAPALILVRVRCSSAPASRNGSHDRAASSQFRSCANRRNKVFRSVAQLGGLAHHGEARPTTLSSRTKLGNLRANCRSKSKPGSFAQTSGPDRFPHQPGTPRTARSAPTQSARSGDRTSLSQRSVGSRLATLLRSDRAGGCFSGREECRGEPAAGLPTR
jgi:hypothetical protein